VKLVVGLGNPGRRYALTRHNIGSRVVERFADEHAIELTARRFGGRFGRGSVADPGGSRLDVGVLEPETYMNLSGGCVSEALRFLPVEDLGRDLLVVLDDVDLPFGRLRIRKRGGAAGHRGLAHIIERLGRSDFPRLRFGVGRPTGPLDTADYVLQRFSPDEEEVLDGRIAEAAEALGAILIDGLTPAMNRYNRDPASAAEDAAEPVKPGRPTD
jgi:PTH1 family peptidyl-tRNA hydrolase